jgi:hypothetical protein
MSIKADEEQGKITTIKKRRRRMKCVFENYDFDMYDNMRSYCQLTVVVFNEREIY